MVNHTKLQPAVYMDDKGLVRFITDKDQEDARSIVNKQLTALRNNLFTQRQNNIMREVSVKVDQDLDAANTLLRMRKSSSSASGKKITKRNKYKKHKKKHTKKHTKKHSKKRKFNKKNKSYKKN